ncbi:MAG TPA: Holliday junction resolvase RuvX [Candidatus Paceibacterota bacterium]
MRYVGIDFGTKRVGVAASNEEGTIAFPRMTLPNDDHLLHEVVRLLRQDEIETVVMGDSRNGKGEENTVMKPARAFADELERCGLKVLWHPEMYTSAEAARAPGSTAATLDASAAAVMLQSFLDTMNRGKI